MSEITTVTAGIDVAKATLEVAIHRCKSTWQVERTPKGLRKLAELMRLHKVEHIGIEATGGYERIVVEHLRAAGFAVQLLQPIQVRAFAQVTLRRAKTDRIDAALIAAYVAQHGILRQPPDPHLAALAERLTCLEHVEEDMARLKVRLEHTRQADSRRVWLDDLARLKARRAKILATLVTLIRRHDDQAARLDLLLSIDGIATRTALALLIRMPELGRLSREEAAALAGLAPFARDSGRHRGQRHIAGGRTRLRTSLYAAAFPASFRWNAQLVALYSRLTQAGKPHKLALVACARKLLLFANAVLARGTPWVKSAAAI